MKKITLYLFTTVILCTISCNNDDDNNSGDNLPPATQTGAGTFACTVNGQNFIDTSGGFFNCFYQFVDGEYYFGIQGLDTVGNVTSINFGTENKTINQGTTYNLLDNIDGNVWGGIGFSGQNNPFQAVFTNVEYTGELTITKLDFENNIVSGTFWFDLENPYTGETVEIRQGRFDTLFTQ